MSILDNPTVGLGNGRATVTKKEEANTISSTSVAAKWVVLTAFAGNEKDIVVGGKGVKSKIAERTGIVLAKGVTSPVLPVSNLKDIFIDSEKETDGVSFVYAKGE